jgi:hypothetical protein
MIGYLFRFKIWAAVALTASNLASELSSSCGITGNCVLCHTDNVCFADRKVVIFELNLEQTS